MQVSSTSNGLAFQQVQALRGKEDKKFGTHGINKQVRLAMCAGRRARYSIHVSARRQIRKYRGSWLIQTFKYHDRQTARGPKRGLS